MKTVCVFCSSSDEVSDKIKKDGALFGQLLAKNGYALLYGGTNSGLMKVIADSHKANGGYLIGVIPEYMQASGEQYKNLDLVISVDDLGSRKQAMLANSNFLVTLPGGIGTYDEFFDAYSLKTVNRNDKPMFILNSEGYFNPLIALIEYGIKNKTISEDKLSFFKVACTPEELIKNINSL